MTTMTTMMKTPGRSETTTTTTTATKMMTTTQQRAYFLDSVRVVLIICLILYHNQRIFEPPPNTNHITIRRPEKVPTYVPNSQYSPGDTIMYVNHTMLIPRPPTYERLDDDFDGIDFWRELMSKQQKMILLAGLNLYMIVSGMSFRLSLYSRRAPIYVFFGKTFDNIVVHHHD